MKHRVCLVAYILIAISAFLANPTASAADPSMTSPVKVKACAIYAFAVLPSGAVMEFTDTGLYAINGSKVVKLPLPRSAKLVAACSIRNTASVLAVDKHGSTYIPNNGFLTPQVGDSKVLKVLSTGVIDKAFSVVGTPLSQAVQIAVQGDGRLLILEVSGPPVARTASGDLISVRRNFNLTRYEPSGSVDQSFKQFDFGTGPSGEPTSAWFSPDQHGSVYVPQSDPSSYGQTLVRLLANGEIDSEYKSTVVFQSQLYPDADFSWGVGLGIPGVVQTNGQVVLRGELYSDKLPAGQINGVTFSAVRLNADGTLDDSLKILPVPYTQTPQQGAYSSIIGAQGVYLVEKSGKIITLGVSQRNAVPTPATRYNPDGGLDQTFHPTRGVAIFAAKELSNGNLLMITDLGALITDSNGVPRGKALKAPQQVGFALATHTSVVNGGLVVTWDNSVCGSGDSILTWTAAGRSRSVVAPATGTLSLPSYSGGSGRGNVLLTGCRNKGWFFQGTFSLGRP